MDLGCWLKSVIFIWSVEQGWPQPDSSQTKIISYIPFPQVCPVSLDTEDEVNQVKDVVMLLGLIRLSQAAGRSDHHWALTTGRLLRTSAAPSIRSDERNIALSQSDLRPACCLLFCLSPHLSPEQQELSGTPPTGELSFLTSKHLGLWLPTWLDGSGRTPVQSGHFIFHKYGPMMRLDKARLLYSILSSQLDDQEFPTGGFHYLIDYKMRERDPNWLRWDGFRLTSGEETSPAGPGHELQPVHVCWPNWRLTQPSQAQRGTDMIWSGWKKGFFYLDHAWLHGYVHRCHLGNRFLFFLPNGKTKFFPWYFYDWLKTTSVCQSWIFIFHKQVRDPAISNLESRQ